MINLDISTYKNNYDLNKAIGLFLSIKTDTVLSADERNFLTAYSGDGGLIKQGAEGKGVLYEFYTPEKIIDLCWHLVRTHRSHTSTYRVLEPACGTGRFIDSISEDPRFEITGMEIDPISSKISQLLYPNTDIQPRAFETLFIDNNRVLGYRGSSFDCVIGNPPYGPFQNFYKGLGEGKFCQRYEDYFVCRGLDVLAEGGLLVMVMPSIFLNKVTKSSHKEIFGKSCLIDAYRLPRGVFDRTEIGTDVIVLRKDTSATYDLETLEHYFTKNPSKVLGSWSKRRNLFGQMEDVVIEDPKMSLDDHLAAIMTISKPIDLKSLWKAVQVDGSVQGYNTEDAPQHLNTYQGKVFMNHHYFQGNIRERLFQLEQERLSVSTNQYMKQKEGLEALVPKLKTIYELALVPTSEFARCFRFSGTFTTEYGSEEEKYIVSMFKQWLYSISLTEREGLTVNDMHRYISGESVAGYTKEENHRIKEKRKTVTDRCFKEFLTQLPIEEQELLTKAFNDQYNAYSYPSYTDIPVWAEGISGTFKGKPLNVKPTQYEGVAFLTHKGVGALAFDVGVGKTMTGIIATVETMQKGWSKRPLFLVPNSVYANWIKEITDLFPDITVNKLGNLSDYDGEITDGSLSIMTHEGLERIGYSDDVREDLLNEVIDQMAMRSTNKRKGAQEEERCDMFLGKAQRRADINIDIFGFDHVTVDEAHRFKNLFSKADSRRDKVNEFSGLTASASMRAAKLFLFTQYILRHNGNRNVFLLTATPFNNSPLEVYNMLSYIARYRLRKMGINNVNDFMEMFVDAHYDWVVKPSGTIAKQQVVKGFLNAGVLRDLISEFMMFRTAADADVKRPEDTTKIIELDPSDLQSDLMKTYECLAMSNKSQGDVLKAISKMRLLALSPHIVTSEPHEISPKDFVEHSPKLLYTARAIQRVLLDAPDTSQLIYFPQGKAWIPHFERYLTEILDIPKSDIANITSATSAKRMISIEEKFNQGKIKVLIGTSKISEGMNLNRNTSLLYNLFLDWNPTTQMQVKGRIHRQGNRYDKIRIIYPVLRNSIESMMFQKLEEKTARINNIWDAATDYISTEILNPEELKLSIITDPRKKASMYITIKEEALTQSKLLVTTKMDVLNDLKEKWKTLQGERARYSDCYDGFPEHMITHYKRNLKEIKGKENSVLVQMKKRHATPETLASTLEDLHNKSLLLDQLKEAIKALFDEKVLQYTEELKISQQTTKSIDSLIDTDLYLENIKFYEINLKTCVRNVSKSLDLQKSTCQIFEELPKKMVVYYQPMLLAV